MRASDKRDARDISDSADSRAALSLRLFVACLGAFLGLALLKFGNPPVMESLVRPPRDGWELVFASPWPIAWAYWLLGLAALLGLASARWRQPDAPLWLIALPLTWLAWQVFAASQATSAGNSWGVVGHFAACVACFYLGLFSLSNARSLALFWLGLSLGFVLMLAFGWEQHFGGLEQMRQYFYTDLYPQMKSPLPPDYLKRLASDRIFSTLFYPNTLAGALLLMMPPILVVAGGLRRLTIPARAFVALVIGVGGFACLYWSGSKAGWLLMLLLGMVVLLRLPLGAKFKAGLAAAMLAAGLAGFFWHHAAFFAKGATSAVARLDYWQAAVRIAKHHPLVGSGPGTFGAAYKAVKRPGAEWTELTHNDYLEQACDSGLPGFVAYSAFILGTLLWSAARFRPASRGRQAPGGPSAGLGHEAKVSVPGAMAPFSKWLVAAARQIEAGETAFSGPAFEWRRFAVWLGVLGWSLQGLFEFGLYVPALAWPAFAFLGWLAGTSGSLDNNGKRSMVRQGGQR